VWEGIFNDARIGYFRQIKLDKIYHAERDNVMGTEKNIVIECDDGGKFHGIFYRDIRVQIGTYINPTNGSPTTISPIKGLKILMIARVISTTTQDRFEIQYFDPNHHFYTK
jgi:hypothetical protein